MLCYHAWLRKSLYIFRSQFPHLLSESKWERGPETPGLSGPETLLLFSFSYCLSCLPNPAPKYKINKREIQKVRLRENLALFSFFLEYSYRLTVWLKGAFSHSLFIYTHLFKDHWIPKLVLNIEQCFNRYLFCCQEPSCVERIFNSPTVYSRRDSELPPSSPPHSTHIVQIRNIMMELDWIYG